jgi:PAS domain S-box-containing protein
MRNKEDPNRKDTEDQIKIPSQIKMLSKSVESSNDAIITTTLDGIVTSWNRGAELTYGYSAKEILGISISILDPPVLVGETIELNELTKFEEQINNYETLRVRKDGKLINVSLTLSPILDESENLIAILIVARDITKSKKTEEKLTKTQELYRIATEQTGQIIYNYNLISDKCSWAGAIEEVTGYSFEEFQMLGKYVWITKVFPLEEPGIIEPFTKRINGNRFSEELKFKRKDGTLIYIENRGVLLKDGYGHPYESIGVIKDVTDLKNALDKMEESETKYRSFVQNFHGVVFQFDENFVPIFMDGAVEEITGYREKDFMSRNEWQEIIYPADLTIVLKEEEKVRNFPSPGYVNIEYRIKHLDGSIRWVNEIFQKIYRENGKHVLYQGTLYDITERKETEKFLANIETARKQEIHHRIKNNLQVISSLLDLQAQKFDNRKCIEDSEVKEAFKESQERVISMALIHEELHKSGKMDTLNFSQYIEKLAENLFLTYRIKNTGIGFDKDIEKDIFFDMDISVPLGIIINELMSNSLKYAFIDRKKGEIRIGLHREKNGECKNEDCNGSIFILSVSDNGVGIPEDIDIENPNSLGLQLVVSLVDQLDGELELKRNKGTEFTVRFAVPESNNMESAESLLQLADND